MTRVTKTEEGMEEYLLSLKEVTNNQSQSSVNRAYRLARRRSAEI